MLQIKTFRFAWICCFTNFYLIPKTKSNSKKCLNRRTLIFGGNKEERRKKEHNKTQFIANMECFMSDVLEINKSAPSICTSVHTSQGDIIIIIILNRKKILILFFPLSFIILLFCDLWLNWLCFRLHATDFWHRLKIKTTTTYLWKLWWYKTAIPITYDQIFAHTKYPKERRRNKNETTEQKQMLFRSILAQSELHHQHTITSCWSIWSF